MREVHDYKQLLCGVTDHMLFLWNATSGHLVNVQEVCSSTTACVSRSGKFFLAIGGRVSVFGIDIPEDE